MYIHVCVCVCVYKKVGRDIVAHTYNSNTKKVVGTDRWFPSNPLRDTVSKKKKWWTTVEVVLASACTHTHMHACI